MWIAKDRDGTYNAFIMKPRLSGWIKNKWTTSPYPTLWENIPYMFIKTLTKEIAELRCTDDPIEVSIIPCAAINSKSNSLSETEQENSEMLAHTEACQIL